jgi:hypothetical protein
VCRLSLGGMGVVVALVTSGNAYARGGTYHHSDPEFFAPNKPKVTVGHPHHEPSHRGSPKQQQRAPTIKGKRQ